jgi:hypothetical protein
MKLTRLLLASSLIVSAFSVPALVHQTSTHAAPPAPPAAPAGNCKTFGAGKCCSPDVTLHLSKDAIFSACGESDATFLGEAGSKDTCKFHFKVAGENSEETFVQVYSPPAKEVLDKPTDPFMSFKKVGKVWVTDKAKSPKAAAQVNASTGLYMPGRGYFVSVSASTKVCTKTEAVALSKAIK